MDANKVLQELKNRTYRPFYLLHGDEDYFIDLISDYIADHILSESQKGFDQTILYGKETSFSTIVNAAKRFPMIGDYQVIIVKEAQSLSWKDEGDLLSKYLSQPAPNTILVFAYKHGKFDKRKKIYKQAEKAGVVVESARLYSNKIPAWVSDYLSAKGRKIHPQAAVLIGEYLGEDLSKIVNELDKMVLNLADTAEISLKDIETNIGISKDFNVFELNDALSQKNALKAFKIVNYFAENPKNHPVPMVFGALNSYFTKVLKYHYLTDKSSQNVAKELGVHPFFTKEYSIAARHYDRAKVFKVIRVLQEYDMKSKGVGMSDPDTADLLKEMVYKILN